MLQLSRSPGGSPRRGRAACALPIFAVLAIPQGASAQAGPNCETIAADVQPEQPTISGQDQYSLAGRTSQQVIQQWATIQDPDPQACRLLKEVLHRLTEEESFARRQCSDVAPGVKSQTDLARGEADILCKGRH